MSRIEPVHAFISYKLRELLIIFWIAWDLNSRWSLLLHSLLIWHWTHAACTWETEDLISALHPNISSWWLRVYLWVWNHSHVLMSFHPSTHRGISSYGASTMRLRIHRLLYKFRKHACSWHYSMVFMCIILRYCFNLTCNVIAEVLCMICEMSCRSCSHWGRFKIRHVRYDPSMPTCESLHRIVNYLSRCCIEVILSNWIYAFSWLDLLSLSRILILWILCCLCC